MGVKQHLNNNRARVEPFWPSGKAVGWPKSGGHEQGMGPRMVTMDRDYAKVRANLGPKQLIFRLAISLALSPFLIGRMFLREPSWKYSATLVGS